MLVRLFRTNQPGILLVLLVLLPLLFAAHFQAAVLDGASGMPLQQLVARWLGRMSWAFGIVQVLVVGILALQITGLVNGADLVDRRNHLPALLFPLCLAVFAEPGSLGSALFGMPFVVFAMRRTWSMNSGGPAMSALFDAGLLLGIASLFYMPYAFVLVVVWASVSVIRPFQWREYLVPLVGIALVFYLAWGVLNLLGVDEWRPLRTVVDSGPSPTVVPAWFTVARAAVLVCISIVALLRFAEHYQRGVVREQNLRSSFLAFATALGVVMALLSFLTDRVSPVLITVPLSMLAVHAFLGTRRAWLGELAVLVLFGRALWRQYG